MADDKQQEDTQKKVIIYTTPTCSFCKMAKAFFQENNVDYEEKDVTQDQQAQAEMIQESGQMGVPVIKIGDQMVVGFDKTRLAELLGV